MTLIVNLAGAPGAGKSTGAAYVFAILKMAGVNAELVTEFAKDKVWEENPIVLKAQDYIFAKQHFRLLRCVGKCQVIVTDSPLPLSVFYNKDPKLGSAYAEYVMGIFNSYENLNFMIHRCKGYQQAGRLQTEAESDLLAKEMEQFYKDHNIPYIDIEGSERGYREIVDRVLCELSR